MKGFPNQIADLGKLAQGMRCIAQMIADELNPRDDEVLGEALLRARVIRPGRRGETLQQYLRVQRQKPRSGQSFQTSARLLRELYRLLGLIDDVEGRVNVTAEGLQAATFAGQPLGPVQIGFWRRRICNLRHSGGDPTESHPYRVLLRLIGQRPGVTRAKCPLALVARDDSAEELERIVALARLTEDRIRARIRVTKSTWNNAKKVLPKFAEQLGDVIKDGQQYRLAGGPQHGCEEHAEDPAQTVEAPLERRRHAAAGRQPRGSRAVTAATIGMAGLGGNDEVTVPPDLDPAAAAAAIRLRLDRTQRHQILLRALAARFQAAGMNLFENPFDALGVLERFGNLVEVKTLDGTQDDERERVRDSLAQLLYYEGFPTASLAGLAIHKIACFEGPISAAHQAWLNQFGIATIWLVDGRFAGDQLASQVLRDYLEELR